MSDKVILRPATRSDISALAHSANAGNAQSALHRRIALYQDQYPTDYYRWRLNIIRQRFATSNLRTMVAVDSTTGGLLGQASWAVEGSDTALHKRWLKESSWMNWLEDSLIWAEKQWSRYVTDRSIDYGERKCSAAGLFALTFDCSQSEYADERRGSDVA
jgi:hypothetical protein